MAAPAQKAARPAAHPLKRSLTIAGHSTSISLEAAFWDTLKEAAAANETSVPELVAAIDRERGSAGLSSAIRVHLLEFVRSQPR